MSIRMLSGYWTIFVGDNPVISCASFDDAWTQVWSIAKAARS